MNKKMIALDIDGTIAEHDGHIASETVEAIKEVEKAGHHVILASGRSYHDIMPVLEHVGLSSEWLVATNGAIIFKNDSERTNERQYKEQKVLQMLPDKHLSYFKEIVPDANFIIEVHGEGFYYDGVFDIPYTDSVQKTKSQIDYFYGKESLRFIVNDHIKNESLLHEHVKRYGEGLFGSHDDTDSVWVEFLHEKADKAYALESIRRKIDVTLDNVIAIGDGHNDIRMLKWAGQYGESYAMGQAHADVKSVAKNITDSVDQLGVVNVLDTLL